MKTTLVLICLVIFLSGCVAPGEQSIVQNKTPTPDLTLNHSVEPINPVENNYPTITTSTSPSNPNRGEPFTLTVTAEDDLGIQNLYWESTNSFATQPESTTHDCNAQKMCTVNWEFTASEDGPKTITVYARDLANLESAKVPMQINVQPFDEPEQSSVCGNSACEEGETPATCSSDCGSPEPSCGDNTCNDEEAFEICPGDCPYNGFACANGVCEGGESYESCSQDCGLSNIIGTACGDGACEPGEDAGYCPTDCTSIKPNCGNNICNSWETETTCRADCEGVNANGEDCNSNQDCGYREICQSGTCTGVDCTNDAQCGYGKECENNRCVRCPRGPYGPAC